MGYGLGTSSINLVGGSPRVGRPDIGAYGGRRLRHHGDGADQGEGKAARLCQGSRTLLLSERKDLR